jgi:carboxyl-terminal processing protease
MKFQHLAAAALVLFSSLLSACGSGDAPAPAAPPPSPHVEQPGRFDYFKYYNRCAVPRKGADAQGFAYPDVQGTLDDELNFLKAYLDDSYLWYQELPLVDLDNFHGAIEFFDAYKSHALTPSGALRDKYHFTYDSARWEALQRAGANLGYGVTWARPAATVPRTWLAVAVEPGSPAAAAGLRRGDRLLRADGVDFVNAGDAASVAKINAAVSPLTVGELHQFAFERAGAVFEASLAAANVTVVPVRNVQLFDSPAGKIGYLTFVSHNNVSEHMLYDAFTTLRDAGVSELVLDMRYNGGGLLYVASELAYMVAGPGPTAGKIFERPVHNDKTPVQPVIDFATSAAGFGAADPLKAGTPLPYLGLKRVTLLTTAGTCSASESVINSLRGVDVEVILVGGATCGKPYAFTPLSNCGTTYFSIEFKGVNNKGFGDYADGFAPSCAAPDDLAHAVGERGEAMLDTAISRLVTGACPAGAAAPGLRSRALRMDIVRDPVHEIGIAGAPPKR